MIRLLSLGALAAWVLVLLPGVSDAASLAFCGQYATAAVNQARAGRSLPGCRGSMTGDRWSPDYRVHYDWCLANPPAAAETERGVRTGFIQSCRG